jgi:hypothetical protein
MFLVEDLTHLFIFIMTCFHNQISLHKTSKLYALKLNKILWLLPLIISNGARENGLEQQGVEGALKLGLKIKVSIKYKYTFDQCFKSPIFTLHKTLQPCFMEGISQCDTPRVSNLEPTRNHIRFSPFFWYPHNTDRYPTKCGNPITIPKEILDALIGYQVMIYKPNNLRPMFRLATS